jgi:hypothetical protein
MAVHNYTYALDARATRDPIAEELERLWRLPARQPPRRLMARGANDLLFSGVVVTLDTPSARPPQGSEGRRVVVPSALARDTIDQWPGLPLNMASGLGDHEKSQVIGHITGASISGKELRVVGRLYDKNMAQLTARLEATAAPLAMSFENTEVHVVNAAADPWVLQSCVWTGAAVLARAAAAFPGTSFALAAAAHR